MKRLNEYRIHTDFIPARLKKFARHERGNASVEMVMVVPLFMLVLGLSVDFSMSFLKVNEMYDVARDTARRAAVGAMSNAEAQAFAASELPDALEAIITVVDGATEDVVVTITAPAENISTLGYLTSIGMSDRTVSLTMRREG